jgi:predicted 3-demethylubiquinone-9 3-methyltransferase (glyoxalase superfamily)
MMRDGSKLQFADFEIDGQHFMAMDGGPEFEFGMGNSLFVNCEDQAEVDNLWAKFTEDGTPGQCGWLTDKYGVSWQIVPKILGELMMDKDPAKADKVMQAMLKMGKLEVSGLQAAYNS